MKYAIKARNIETGEIQIIKTVDTEKEAERIVTLGNTPINKFDIHSWFYYSEKQSENIP